jgi:hypothetical protein
VASFDELTTLIEDGRPSSIVIDSTQSRGTLYTHDLNRKISNSLNFIGSIFFHRTSSVDVSGLREAKGSVER